MLWGVVKVLCNTILVLNVLYFSGDVVRQNPRLSSLVDLTEGGYKNLNEKLSKAEIVEAIWWMQKLCMAVCLGLLVVSIALGMIFGGPVIPPEIASIGLLISAFGWISVRYVLSHSAEIEKFAVPVIFSVAGPVLAGLADHLLDLGLFAFFDTHVAQPMRRDGLPIPQAAPILTGAVLSLIFLGCWLFMSLFMWVLALFVVLHFALLVFVIVNIAKAIGIFTPRTPFAGFLALLGVAALITEATL